MSHVDEIGVEDIKTLHEHGVDLDNDIIYLDGSGEDGEITAEVARRFRKNLNTLAKYGAEEITVEINSPGGDVTAGLAIYDSIVTCPARVVGRVTGEASSMASVILQACTRRVLSPNACVMYHAGGTGMEKPTGEFPAAAAYAIAEGERIDRIMYDRCAGPRPWSDFQLQVLKGIYLTAEQAVEYGWADEVMRPRERT